MRRIALAAAALLGAVCLAQAEPRTALVIGNGAYPSGALANAVNDATDMADALGKVGFEVISAANADHRAMDQAIEAFGARLMARGGVGLFYYSGHGVQVGGDNYLLPIGAALTRERDVKYEAVNVGEVMDAMKEAGNGLNIVVLDACRNNPFLVTMRSTSATRAIGRGLARVEPSQATLVAYSAKEGTVASDGDAGNSPFAAALARRVTEAGVEINKVFRFVRSDVLTATGGVQEPFVYGSLPPEDFFFVPPG